MQKAVSILVLQWTVWEQPLLYVLSIISGSDVDHHILGVVQRQQQSEQVIHTLSKLCFCGQFFLSSLQKRWFLLNVRVQLFCGVWESEGAYLCSSGWIGNVSAFLLLM